MENFAGGGGQTFIMSVIFSIDTTNNKACTVSLILDGKEAVETRALDRRKGQVVLPLLEELLTTHKLELSDVTEIKVNPGPGSFTGIRVGITIANTLGYLLNVPVNGKKATPVEAVYS